MSDQRLFYLLHTAHHRLFKQADKLCLEQLGITSVQLSALFYLQRNDGCQAKALSQGLSLNNSAITGLVNRMVNLGLVTKNVCDKDARAAQIHLTDKAKEILPKGIKLVKQVNQQIAAQFTDNELDTIVRFLKTLANGDDMESQKL